MKFTRATPLGAALSTFVASLILLETGGAAFAAEPPGNTPIHVDTNDEDLEILDRTNLTTMVPVGRYGTLQRQPVFSTLCARSPCDASVAQGRHVLAVSRPGGNIVAADAAVVIDEPSNVHADFVDRSALRGGGIVVLGASLVVSLGLTFASVGHRNACYGNGACRQEIDAGLFGASLATLLAGSIVATILLFQKDSVSFSVTPLTLGATREAAHVASTSLLPNGLGLTMRF